MTYLTTMGSDDVLQKFLVDVHFWGHVEHHPRKQLPSVLLCPAQSLGELEVVFRLVLSIDEEVPIGRCETMGLWSRACIFEVDAHVKVVLPPPMREPISLSRRMARQPSHTGTFPSGLDF